MIEQNENLIDPTALIAADARLTAPKLSIGQHVQVLPGAVIEAGQEICLEPGAVIGRDVKIRAHIVRVGYGTRIGDNCQIRAQKGQPAERVSLGDYSLLEFNANVLARRFEMGDYVSIYQGLYVAGGRQACTMGHNCWIGQDAILDANEQLTLGNNVRIGTRSQLWTHVASGELLEGCVLFGRQPLVIEDNVWIVGGAVISPGLVLRNGSIVMVGAVLTKSTEARHCYAGVPAKDVSDKLKTYQPVTLEDKWRMMGEFLAEFAGEARAAGYTVEPNSAGYQLSKAGYRFAILLQRSVDTAQLAQATQDTLVFTLAELPVIEHPRVSVFSLLAKQYSKRRTPGERQMITFLNGYMARFVPAP